MYTWENLNIVGYKNREVPNTFIRQKETASCAALMLPGWGYTAHMPLLYYAADILLNRGVDVLQVDYGYSTLPEFGALDSAGRNRWLAVDVEAAYQVLIAQRAYQHIVLIGKSLGTLGMGHLLATQVLPATTSAIWMTPLVKNTQLRAQMKAFEGAALIVIGTADGQYDANCIAEIGETALRKVLAIPGADHGMNIGTDVVASISVLSTIMQSVQEFADEHILS